MKLVSLTIVALLIGQTSYSQKTPSLLVKPIADTTKVKSFETEYFILGTLSDYMGRFRYVDRNLQVDIYASFEKPLVNFLATYIKRELNIEVDTVLEQNTATMFSDELSKKLNSFYGQKDALIEDKFKTDRQINSFLAGVYYRYGERLDSSIYKIRLANSSKHQNCYEFLKRIGCENIFYQYRRSIPAQFILYFEPTNEMKKYLDLIEPEKVILKKSFDAWMEKTVQMTTAEINKYLAETPTDELDKIKRAFKR